MLATVPQDSCVTFGDPATMTNKELVAVAIQAFAKIQQYVPYIMELRKRFEAGERNSENRLREPIEGCHSWKEFCNSILNRNYESVRAALAAAKNPKKESRQLADADIAVYEQEHPDIRNLTRKLLAQMNAADAVLALVGMETPPQIADAIVRIVVAENNESQQPSKSSELKTALEQQIAKARELTSLFTDAEVSRSAAENLFHLTLRNLTEEQVRQIAVGVKQ